MSKASEALTCIEEALNSLGSDELQNFYKGVKKVQLKRDKKWYAVKDVSFDKGFSLVGVPGRVMKDEIVNVAK